MINGFRYLSMLIWAVPLTIMVASLGRSLFGSKRSGDSARAATWFTAVCIFGFNLRWVIFPHPEVVMAQDEAIVWAGLYMLSCIAGVWLAASVWVHRD